MTRTDHPAQGFCPEGTCDGSGWILGEDDVARPCACRKAKIQRARTQGLGSAIPKRFRNVAWDRNPIRDLDPVVLRAVRGFVSRIDRELDDGNGLWFYSEPSKDGDGQYSGAGTGKTALATLVSKEADAAGHTVLLYSVPQLLALIRDTYREDSKLSYRELFVRLCEVDLLQLDDLGAEKQTEWVLEQLYSIVNERWQNQRSILVTSNKAPQDLREEIGFRTLSRLAEICGTPVRIDGADRRLVPPELRNVEDDRLSA